MTVPPANFVSAPKEIRPVQKPRRFLVYALAPEGMPAAEANRLFNAFIGDRRLPLPVFHDHFIGDRRLPLPVFHDHFIGRPGGVAVFYAATAAEREALVESQQLAGWQVETLDDPLIPEFRARSPAGFDAQTAFTLRALPHKQRGAGRGRDWGALRREPPPETADAGREAETAEEDAQGDA